VLAHPSRPVVYVLVPSSGTVCEIDAATLSLSRRSSLGRPALGMRLSPDTQSLWLCTIESPELVRLPLDRFRPDARIPLPAAPADFDLSPRTPLAGVSFATGEVVLADLTTRRVVQRLRCGADCGAVRFRSDGEHLLAANPSERRLSILDTASGSLITQLMLAVRPEQLCFNTDGGQLFITGAGMDAVVIVYPYRTEVAQTRLAGHNPGAMAVSSGRTAWLFVANPKAGDVTIIEIETQRVIAVAAVGADPSFITVTPNDQYALVLTRASGDMAVIRLGAVKPDRRRSAPLLTMIPVGSRPVSAAVRES
jgi:DNA-binding beta-propeller fold protein YncE